MDAASPNLYVVVCSELHYAVGPYTGAQAAIDMARRLTFEGRCEYMAVPLKFTGEIRYEAEQETETVYPTGQYL